MSELSERLRKAYAWACEMWAGDEAPEKDSCAALCKEAADENDRLTSQLAEARAIIERLPLTSDGVRIIPGVDKVWCNDPWLGVFQTRDWKPQHSPQCYSTREAAEKARNP